MFTGMRMARKLLVSVHPLTHSYHKHADFPEVGSAGTQKPPHGRPCGCQSNTRSAQALNAHCGLHMIARGVEALPCQQGLNELELNCIIKEHQLHPHFILDKFI